MKLKVFIMAALLFTILGIFNPTEVSAATDKISGGDWISGIYIKRDRPSGYSNYQQAQWINRQSDGHWVYCIQPGVPIDNTLWYDVYDSNQAVASGITQAQWDRIVLLAHYGYGYNQDGYNHTSTNWYVITQMEIWKIAEPTWDIYYTDTLNGNKISRFTSEIAELNKLVDEHYKVPSFDNSNQTMTIGSSITLTDTNGVLSNYNISSNSSVDVTKNGNQITITAKAVGTTTLSLTKSSSKWSTPPLVYVNPNSQNVISTGYFDPISAKINITILGGNITLNKLDYDNNSKTTQGLGTLAGAVYEVYDSNRVLVKTITTNSSGNATATGLPLGTYYVREKTPSTGYLLDANEYTVNITIGNLDHTVTSKEQVIKGRISINKKDLETNSSTAQSDATLLGAVYQIRNSNNVVVATLTTDANGYAISGLLPYDNYTIKEITPSTGYLLDNTTYYVNLTENNVTYNKVSLEQVIKGRIKINKIDFDNNSKQTCGEGVLNGAVYEIFNSKGELADTVVTDTDGYATSKALPYGRYFIKEKTASEGYLLDLSEYEEFLSIDGSILTVTSKEKIIRRDIEILKSYSQKETGILVPESNITFEIYNKWNVLVATATTDAYGYLKITGLPYGHYLVRQVNSPSGIEKMSDFTFNVKGESPDPIIRYNIVNNGLNAYLKLVKIDSITKEVVPIAGIKFMIYNIDKGEFVSMKVMYPYPQIINAFETNEFGYFLTPEELEVGNYKIIELDQVIDGYLYNDSHFYFSINGESEIEADLDYGNIITIYFENQRVLGKLEIIKEGQDLVIENGTYKYIDINLANVKFNVYADEDIYFNGELIYTKDTLIDTIITDENGYAYFDILYLGKYYIVEIETVNNNVLNNDPVYFEFKYKDQYTAVIEVLKELENKYSKGTLEFTKTDLTSGKGIADVIIEIYTENDELIFTGKTDQNGKIIITDLFVGKFYIVEKEPATGYKINDEKVYFEILENGEIIKSSMTNEKVKGTLELTKIDVSTGEVLPNTLIEIYDEFDNLIFSGRTDEFGMIILENLEYGKYYILEKEAPEGYVLNTEKMWFEILEDGQIIKATLENEQIIVEVPNTGLNPINFVYVGGLGLILLGLGIVLYGKQKK